MMISLNELQVVLSELYCIMRNADAVVAMYQLLYASSVIEFIY